MAAKSKRSRSARSDHSIVETLADCEDRNRQMGSSGQKVKPFIFLKVPRTASESMHFVFKRNVINYIRIGRLSRIAEFEHLRRGERPDLNRFHVCYNHMPLNVIMNEGLCPQEFFDGVLSFCFVRNPWTRMMSVWFVFGNTSQHTQLKGCKTFKDFVRKLHVEKIVSSLDVNSPRYRIPDQQWRWTHPDLSFIGRFENLLWDWDAMCDMIGFDHDLTIHQRMHYVKEKPPMEELYDEETADMVEEMYAKDVWAFGYDKERTFAGDKTSAIGEDEIKKRLGRLWNE